MGGNGRRDEDYLFQAKSFSNFFRSPQMAQMDGIKGSSEKTHPLSSVFPFNVKPPLWSIQLKQLVSVHKPTIFKKAVIPAKAGIQFFQVVLDAGSSPA
jgi:hypothetical protein